MSAPNPIVGWNEKLDAVAAYPHLEAERDRYRAALERITEPKGRFYWCETVETCHPSRSSDCPDYPPFPLNHLGDCPVRIAWSALKDQP